MLSICGACIVAGLVIGQKRSSMTDIEPTVSLGGLSEPGSSEPAMPCPWPGEDCSSAKCCAVEGQQCFSKDGSYAACKPSCDAGEPDPTEQSGEVWTCNVLAAGDESGSGPAAPASPGSGAGTSLFCFTVVMPTEVALVDAQRERGAGIFACDDSTTFDGIISPQAPWGGAYNAEAFIDIWNRVREDGRYSQRDWTVKTDPDTVFLADRLRGRLSELNAPASSPGIYIQNCEAVGEKFGFQGAFEVLSLAAIQQYLAFQEDCAKYNPPAENGEDGWMHACLVAIGVGYMQDFNIMNDKWTWPDDIKVGEWLADSSFCQDNEKAAFHPLKEPGLWLQCYDQASSASEAFQNPF